MKFYFFSCIAIFFKLGNRFKKKKKSVLLFLAFPYPSLVKKQGVITEYAQVHHEPEHSSAN